MDAEKARVDKYWKSNRRIIGALLLVWGFVSLGLSVLLIEPLNAFTFFGLPLGFWIAQQGAIYVFVLIIFLYAWLMDRLDKSFHMDE